jgi:hypothetical protein
MSLIKIILALFAAFAAWRSVSQFRSGVLDLKRLAVWLVFWTAVIIVVLIPETSSRLAGLFGVGRGADLIVYLGLAGAYFLIFRIFSKIEESERRITRLVRELALKDLEK